MMEIGEMRIGMRVADPRTMFPMDVVGIFSDGSVLCDFDGNDGDVWEYHVSELIEI